MKVIKDYRENNNNPVRFAIRAEQYRYDVGGKETTKKMIFEDFMISEWMRYINMRKYEEFFLPMCDEEFREIISIFDFEFTEKKGKIFEMRGVAEEDRITGSDKRINVEILCDKFKVYPSIVFVRGVYFVPFLDIEAYYAYALLKEEPEESEYYLRKAEEEWAEYERQRQEEAKMNEEKRRFEREYERRRKKHWWEFWKLL